MGYVNINGRITAVGEASVSYDNRAFRYGYGLFETMLCKDGEIALKQWHWERLFAGMQQLYFDTPKLFTAEYLEQEIMKTVVKNNLQEHCRIRLQVYMGSGGLYDGKNQQPNFVIECFPLDRAITQLNENGLVTGIAKGIFKSKDDFSHLKTTNALVYALAAQQAKEHKWNDALILNTDEQIIESTIANIFIVKGSDIYTPPLSDGCIAGVMRRYLLHKLPILGYNVMEQSIRPADMEECDEIILTNAIRRLKWVYELNHRTYTNTIALKLYKQLFTTDNY